MRGRGAEACGHLPQPLLGVGPLRAALVIGHVLVRLTAGELQGVPGGLVDGFEILGVADVASQEDLAGSIDDLIDIQGGQLVAAVHISPVEEVQPGSIAVPERIGQGGKDGRIHTGIVHLGLRVADNRAIPLNLHFRPLKEIGDGGRRLHRLPAARRRHLVVFRKDLCIGVDGHPGALEGDDVRPGLRRDLAGVGIHQVTAHQAYVAITLILADLVPQAGRALREGVPVGLTHLLALGIDGRPVDGRAVAIEPAAHSLRLLHFDKGIQH